jgi:Secretion system C-terminal sorting domain
MKYLYAAFFWKLLVLPLSAQTFFPLPGALQSSQVAFEQANECYIHFKNPSGDTLQLRWRLLERSLPDGWDVDLCDYGLCYEGIPPNGTMNPVYDTIRPYLKLIVQPGSSGGAGWVWFRAYELGNNSNFQDVYFSLHTPGTLSLPSLDKRERFSVFPNPAQDHIFLSNPTSNPLHLTIFSLQGIEVAQLEIAPLGQSSLTVSHWAKGIYWVKSEHATQLLIKN